MPIAFRRADIKFRLPDTGRLKSFIEARVKKESGKKIYLIYVFCSDDFLLNINKQFLSHDFYTDIITFPLSQSHSEIEAEIYISVDRIKENAKVLKLSFKSELQRVIFHGVLHLLGWKDKTKSQEKAMRAKEEEWMALFSKRGTI